MKRTRGDDGVPGGVIVERDAGVDGDASVHQLPVAEVPRRSRN